MVAVLTVVSALRPGRDGLLHLLRRLGRCNRALKHVALDREVLVGLLLRERLILDGVERLLARALRPLSGQRQGGLVGLGADDGRLAVLHGLLAVGLDQEVDQGCRLVRVAGLGVEHVALHETGVPNRALVGREREHAEVGGLLVGRLDRARLSPLAGNRVGGLALDVPRLDVARVQTERAVGNPLLVLPLLEVGERGHHLRPVPALLAHQQLVVQLRAGRGLQQVLEQAHDVPAVLACGGQRGFSRRENLLVGLLELGVRLRRRGDARLLEQRLVVPAGDAGGDERDAGLYTVERHALDRRGRQLGVPAVLLVVLRQIRGLLRLHEGVANLAAPDPPDVRALAAQQFGLQLVRVHRGARARQGVDGRGHAVLLVKLLRQVPEKPDRLVVLVGEDTQRSCTAPAPGGAASTGAAAGGGTGARGQADAGGGGTQAEEASAGDGPTGHDSLLWSEGRQSLYQVVKRWVGVRRCRQGELPRRSSSC